MRELYFIGDIHNNISNIISEIVGRDLKDTDLIQVGDFGVGFPQVDVSLYDEVYSGLDALLFDRNCTMYVVRGNHDNPMYFKGDNDYDNLKFVPDYSVLTFNNWNFLCIGGGVSVDRTYRRKTNSGWWKGEIVKQDITKVEGLTDIDVVITHSNTTFAYPNHATPSEVVKHWSRQDDELWNDIKSERYYIDSVYNKLTENNNLKLWVYGHYHKSHSQIINNIEFRLLNINEWYKCPLFNNE